jgi:hypothetical protein
MTQDDIIKLAREAGLFTHKEVQPEILAFANLVAAAERDKLQSAAEWCRMCERKGVFNEKTTGDETN